MGWVPAVCRQMVRWDAEPMRVESVQRAIRPGSPFEPASYAGEVSSAVWTTTEDTTCCSGAAGGEGTEHRDPPEEAEGATWRRSGFPFFIWLQSANTLLLPDVSNPTSGGLVSTHVTTQFSGGSESCRGTEQQATIQNTVLFCKETHFQVRCLMSSFSTAA